MHLAKIGIIIGVVGLAHAIIFPSLKGPYNRMKHNVNDSLNAEYVVDNLKEKYIDLNEKSVNIRKDLQKIDCEIKVLEKKIESGNVTVDACRKNLKNAGTADMSRFAVLKEAYDVSVQNVSNLQVSVAAYLGAKAKMEAALENIKYTMSRAKIEISKLETKKAVVDNLKAVNSTLASISGIGDDPTKIGLNVEKLDEDLIRAEAEHSIYAAPKSQTMSEAEAAEFLKSL